MPVITIEGSKIDSVDKKRKLVKDITEIASKSYGLPESTIVVLIKENPAENIGSGGKLILDSHKA
jgi:4-oxalocrotonate tautomerase